MDPLAFLLCLAPCALFLLKRAAIAAWRIPIKIRGGSAAGTILQAVTTAAKVLHWEMDSSWVYTPDGFYVPYHDVPFNPQQEYANMVIPNFADRHRQHTPSARPSLPSHGQMRTSTPSAWEDEKSCLSGSRSYSLPSRKRQRGPDHWRDVQELNKSRRTTPTPNPATVDSVFSSPPSSRGGNPGGFDFIDLTG